ncbi:Conserved_hypothetical protein [Hexamita inflata]|uniref:Uncharacterized protein n=1 Tax=Hexamita inflata TaxID=28002 RepID=A0AA86QN93_9EUKA|nr:Conserved hypothetical protein [Hexamita inflata]
MTRRFKLFFDLDLYLEYKVNKLLLVHNEFTLAESEQLSSENICNQYNFLFLRGSIYFQYADKLFSVLLHHSTHQYKIQLVYLACIPNYKSNYIVNAENCVTSFIHNEQLFMTDRNGTVFQFNKNKFKFFTQIKGRFVSFGGKTFVINRFGIGLLFGADILKQNIDLEQIRFGNGYIVTDDTVVDLQKVKAVKMTQDAIEQYCQQMDRQYCDNHIQDYEQYQQYAELKNNIINKKDFTQNIKETVEYQIQTCQLMNVFKITDNLYAAVEDNNLYTFDRNRVIQSRIDVNYDFYAADSMLKPQFYKPIICNGIIYFQLRNSIVRLQGLQIEKVCTIPNSVQTITNCMFTFNNILYVSNNNGQIFIVQNNVCKFLCYFQNDSKFFQFCDKVYFCYQNGMYCVNEDLETDVLIYLEIHTCQQFGAILMIYGSDTDSLSLFNMINTDQSIIQNNQFTEINTALERLVLGDTDIKLDAVNELISGNFDLDEQNYYNNYYSNFHQHTILQNQMQSLITGDYQQVSEQITTITSQSLKYLFRLWPYNLYFTCDDNQITITNQFMEVLNQIPVDFDCYNSTYLKTKTFMHDHLKQSIIHQGNLYFLNQQCLYRLSQHGLTKFDVPSSQSDFDDECCFFLFELDQKLYVVEKEVKIYEFYQNNFIVAAELTDNYINLDTFNDFFYSFCSSVFLFCSTGILQLNPDLQFIQLSDAPPDLFFSGHVVFSGNSILNLVTQEETSHECEFLEKLSVGTIQSKFVLGQTGLELHSGILEDLQLSNQVDCYESWIQQQINKEYHSMIDFLTQNSVNSYLNVFNYQIEIQMNKGTVLNDKIHRQMLNIQNKCFELMRKINLCSETFLGLKVDGEQ